jgi:hypothetical protein
MEYEHLTDEQRTALRAIYDAGFAAGSARPWLFGNTPELYALIEAVSDDWLTSLDFVHATREPRLDLPAIPGWLRDLEAHHAE